jgi:hypothetical protein
VTHSGSGYVTRFEVRRAFLDRYEVRQAGGRAILEYWIPAEDLPELNANIVGLIAVTAEYHQDSPAATLRATTADATPATPQARSTADRQAPDGP